MKSGCRITCARNTGSRPVTKMSRQSTAMKTPGALARASLIAGALTAAPARSG
jgi:hypothetical protein